MSEIICPCCNAASPDTAKYCANCSQPIICRGCGAAILPTARACIQCGKLIPERQNTDGNFASRPVVPPGYNHLEVHHQTENSRYDMNFLFSNTVGEQQSDVISKMVNVSVQVARDGHTPQEQDVAQSFVALAEPTSETPRLPPAIGSRAVDSHVVRDGSTAQGEGAPSTAEQALSKIFRVSDNKLRLQVQDMKANTQQEYTFRLVHLVLYAYQELLNMDHVPRNDIIEITDYAGLTRPNVFAYMSRDGRTTKENDQWSLKIGGFDHAKRVALEVVDPNIKGEYLPAGDTKPATGQGRKGSRKAEAPAPNDKLAPYIAHEETQTLVASIPHDKLAAMPILDKALVALYGLRKSGHAGEVMPSEIEHYLYRAFHVRADHEAVRSALKNAVARNSNRVAHRDHGYHITPSGEKYVEELRGGADISQQSTLFAQSGRPQTSQGSGDTEA